MKSDLDSAIHEFATRQLSPTEARELAQQALDDAGLFDALVAQGAARSAAEASLENPALLAADSAPARHRQWVIALCAVAAAALLAVFLWRSASQQIRQPSQQARAIVSAPAVIPSLNEAGQSIHPVLLASQLGPLHSQNTPAFRGTPAPDREPQSTGMITAVEDGEATVNLGSLDGLAKGTQLGPLVITTVFRDHARGKIVNGAPIRVNDRVQVPLSLHLAAVLREVDALAAAGDLNAARALARNTLATGSSGETRTLLERLAALDYQAGAIDAAREHYEAAANNFYAPPAAGPSEQAATLNSLGALYLLRGDTRSAEKPLNQAAAQTAIDPDLHAQILNNLGVLSEMKGDLAAARDDYSRAHAQGNLRRLANVQHP